MKKSAEINLAVVDDAPFIREVVRHIVGQDKRINLVLELEDGKNAVQQLIDNDVDVVLMDMVMPYKNGIEATKEVLAVKPKLKIIACSTVDQESMIMKALDAGCCSYLTKPFEAKQLMDLIHNSVRK